MFYFDTSFLVPLVLREATSERISSFIREHSGGEFAVSHWTCVEFSSLLAREVRMGEMGASTAAQADVRFEAMLDDSFTIFLPNADDYVLAKQYLGRFETGLRAGDALHLAIARNHRAEMLYSLDQTLIRAGNILGLPVSAGIRVARR